MLLNAVDERDSSWEDDDPRFRVYLVGGGDEPDRSWDVQTCGRPPSWASRSGLRTRLVPNERALRGMHARRAERHWRC